MVGGAHDDRVRRCVADCTSESLSLGTRFTAWTRAICRAAISAPPVPFPFSRVNPIEAVRSNLASRFDETALPARPGPNYVP